MAFDFLIHSDFLINALYQIKTTKVEINLRMRNLCLNNHLYMVVLVAIA